ncbi:MAG TPA: APC family permease [Candidatus Limnocylindria bacterium]
MSGAPRRFISTPQAAFIGVASMVGAGIFSLLGAAGEVAGSAVWISFILAGVVAGLQGYSFAKMGARYPSAGGLIEYLNRGFGDGHVSVVTAWLTFMANGIVTAMVAVSFGSYASAAFTDGDPGAVKLFAAALIVAMTALNVAGSQLVARVQTGVVIVVIGILVVFSVTTLVNVDPALLDPASYPPARDIAASMALTFFAFLGFGIITFTAKDLAEPSRQLPRAMYLALGIATAIYVAVSLGVFGTLTVQEVIDSGGTALAVAAEPVLGNAGYLLMTITALFATAGATNAGLYPTRGLSEHLVSTGQFPPFMARLLGGRVSVGLLVLATGTLILAVGRDLSAIASIGSAVALGIFALATVSHLIIRRETGARLSILVLALLTTLGTLVTFIFTSLIEEPATIAVLAGIILVSIGLDVGWRWAKGRRPAEGG